MGTRNLTMVIDNQGALKVAQYGQWDGYPSGQGAVILEFAKNKDKMNRLEQVLSNLKFFNDCEEFDKYIDAYNNRCPRWNKTENKMSPDNRTEADFYWFDKTKTRDLCAKILDSIITLDTTKLPKEHNNIIYLYNDSEFGQDSLFCEWAYCINFETNKLECFKGFNKYKEREHERFETKQEDVDKNSGYYGIELVKEYDLDNLPSEDDFIKELEACENEN